VGDPGEAATPPLGTAFRPDAAPSPPSQLERVSAKAISDRAQDPVGTLSGKNGLVEPDGNGGGNLIE
jgi:hypothetical protein